MVNPIVIPMTVAVDSEEIPMTVESTAVSVAMVVGFEVEVNTNPDYDGEYEFTPTSVAQTIPIVGHVATQNIVINPVPSNYGLITWNGSVLTVS